MSLNDELLSDDPDSFVVEENDDARYTPYPDKSENVIEVEPDVITIGRKMRRDALRQVQHQTSDQQRNS